MDVPDWANVNLWCRKFSTRVVRFPYIPGAILFYVTGFCVLFVLGAILNVLYAPAAIVFDLLMLLWVGWFFWQVTGKRDYKNLTEYRHSHSSTFHVNGRAVTVTVCTAEPLDVGAAVSVVLDNGPDDEIVVSNFSEVNHVDEDGNRTPLDVDADGRVILA